MNRSVCFAVVMIGPVAGSVGCASSEPARRASYDCHFVDQRVRVDGRLDEPAWARADAVTLLQTINGQPARVGTTARMLWDETFLYVGFECEDNDVSATMRHTDNDLWEEEEVVEVFINVSPGGLSYFEFEVNPNNARLDLSCVADDPGGSGFACEKDWNCVGWHSAVRVDGTPNRPDDTDRGWTCELAIPFESLLGAGRRVSAGDEWGIGLYRINRVGDTVEYSAGSPTRVPTFHAPGRFGRCRFVKPG